jgi:hypothetical protein
MSLIYNTVSKLCDEVVKDVRNKYGVKVCASFEVKGYYIAMSFATDQRQVRLSYFKEEIERGVAPTKITAKLEEAFNLNLLHRHP